MKIPFEAWLLEQNIDPNSRSLFGEALLCYRVGAYRAALVFSYLAFFRVLAHRLMTSDPPRSVPVSIWTNIQKKIRDDNSWESTSFEAATRVQPQPVFLIDDDVRQQLHYWRGRRNDAAHSRGNEVSYAHVEMLWLFIKSNLGRFVVDGGRSGLLERFRRHFDPTYAPPGAHFSELVFSISQSVAHAEYRDFIHDVFEAMGVFEEVKRFPELNDNAEAFVRTIQELADPLLSEALVEEVKSHPQLLLATLQAKPNFVLHYANDPDLIRDLWYSRLRLVPYPYSYFLSNDLHVVAALLRNDLIPKGVRATAVNHVVGRISEGPSRYDYPADLLDDLAQFGFWAAVRSHLQSIEWAAEHLALTIEYLERHPVDSFIARIFCELFPNEVNHDPDDVYILYQATNLDQPEDYANLGLYFGGNPHLFHAIVEVAKQHGIKFEHFAKEMNPEHWKM